MVPLLAMPPRNVLTWPSEPYPAPAPTWMPKALPLFDDALIAPLLAIPPEKVEIKKLGAVAVPTWMPIALPSTVEALMAPELVIPPEKVLTLPTAIPKALPLPAVTAALIVPELVIPPEK